VAFFGHTHVQGGFAWRRGHTEIIARPGPGQDKLVVEFDPDGSYLLNPGSVGQPRDGDPRAAYAIVDVPLKSVELYRVKYPVEEAQAKVIKAGLPEVLAQRLAVGR